MWQIRQCYFYWIQLSSWKMGLFVICFFILHVEKWMWLSYGLHWLVACSDGSSANCFGDKINEDIYIEYIHCRYWGIYGKIVTLFTSGSYMHLKSGNVNALPWLVLWMIDMWIGWLAFTLKLDVVKHILKEEIYLILFTPAFNAVQLWWDHKCVNRETLCVLSKPEVHLPWIRSLLFFLYRIRSNCCTHEALSQTNFINFFPI